LKNDFTLIWKKKKSYLKNSDLEKEENLFEK